MKPAGDVAQVHLDNFNDEYELTDEQLHADNPVDNNYPDERDWYKFENISLYFNHPQDRDKFVKWIEKRDTRIKQEEREKVDKLYSDLWSQAEKEGKHEVSTWLTKQFNKKGNHD